MADETVETTPSTDPPAETVETTDTPAETVVTATPPQPAPEAANKPQDPPQTTTTQTPDIEAEIAAKEQLAAKLETGEITMEEYGRGIAKADRNIAKAQKALIEPAQRVQSAYEEQERARAYWANWGRAREPDVAQLEFAKTVPAAKAKELYQKVAADIEANPRYANRKEMDLRSIVYDRWMSALESESKKKPASATASASSSRITGAGGTAPQPGAGSNKTARQRLDDGEYDAQLQRFSQML